MTTIPDCTTELAELHRDIFPAAPAPVRRAAPAAPATPDDQKIIDKVTADPKWARLWSGDAGAYQSPSEADLALCGRIAFFTGPDAGRIASIFDRSSLTRDKWDRQDYRDRTITKALEGKTEFYNWNGNGHRPARTAFQVTATEAGLQERAPDDLNTSAASTGTAPKKTAEPSPDPIPLSDPDPPPFPDGIFTGWAGDSVEAVSANTETPKELAASVLLGVLAIAAQGKFSVRIEPNYFESLSLYLCPFLTSGHRKTAVVGWYTKALIAFERSQKKELEPKIKRAAIERKAKQSQIKSLQNQIEKSAGADCTELIDQITKLELSIEPEMVVPRVFTQDVTPERLGTLLHMHGERMGLISDEGGIFDLIGGKYNNNIPNLDLFLQAFTGSCVRVDRGCRDAVILDHPALSMVVTPQPEVAEGLAAKPGFRGRGFLSRWLFTMPKPTLGNRSLVSRGIDGRIENAYAEYIGRLLLLPTPKEAEADGPVVLMLDEAAYAAWKGYQRTIETLMHTGGQLEHLTDVGGKWPGMAARLAGILHIADYGASAVDHRHISVDVMDRAIRLADFFLDHGRVVFGHFGADKPLQIARRLWTEIEKLGLLSFAARDVWQPTRGIYKSMDEVQPGFDVLMERGWLLEPDEKDEKRGRGRPSRRYTVNPKAAANCAHFENTSKVDIGGGTCV